MHLTQINEGSRMEGGRTEVKVSAKTPRNQNEFITRCVKGGRARLERMIGVCLLGHERDRVCVHSLTKLRWGKYSRMFYHLDEVVKFVLFAV